MFSAKRKKVVKFLVFALFATLLFSLSSCTYFTKQVKKATEKVKQKTYQDKLRKLLDNPPLVYVASNNGSGHVVIIDSGTDSKKISIPLEGRVEYVAMRPDGSEVYISSISANKIFVIDLKENKLVKTFETKDGPFAIAFHPDGNKAYVCHYASNYISVIDVKKKEIVSTIEVGKQPAAIAISFDGKWAYVGHGRRMEAGETRNIYGYEVPIEPKFIEGSKEIMVIDLEKNEKVADIMTRGNCYSVAVKPDGSLVYATTSSIDPTGALAGESQAGKKDAVVVIDTSKNEIIKEIEFDVGSGPKALAFTPDEKKVYAICGARDDAIVIDTSKHEIITRIPLGLGG